MAIYSVIFTTLNFERTNIVLNHLFSEAKGHSFASIMGRTEESEKEKERVMPKVEQSASVGAVQRIDTLGDVEVGIELEQSRSSVAPMAMEKGEEKVTRSSMISLTPVEVAVQEPILLPTRYAGCGLR
jgi:dihydropteroate synthase